MQGNFCVHCGTPISGGNMNHPPVYNPYYYPVGPVVGQAGKGQAVAALVLGIVSIVLFFPFLNLILGIVGLVMARVARTKGFIDGIRTAGFVVSLIGTIIGAFIAILYLIIILFALITHPFEMNYIHL